MLLHTHKFTRKPFAVEAVQVTNENIEEVAEWCQGQVRRSAGPNGRNPQRYIKLRVPGALNTRQTQAYINDWVVQAQDEKLAGFKVYKPKAFHNTFDEVKEHMGEVLARTSDRLEEEDRLEQEGLFPEELFSHQRA
jgi:hypothetical protein